jgi:hypothetical protein
MAAIGNFVHIDTGSSGVTSTPVTVPPNVGPYDLVCIIVETSTSTVGVHTVASTGRGSVTNPGGGALNGQTSGTTMKTTFLCGIGNAPGDVLTITTPGSGITVGDLFVAPGYAFDAAGAAMASGSPSTQTVPSVTSNFPDCEILALCVGNQTSARTVSSIASPYTLEDSVAGGGGTRLAAIAVGDQILAAQGASGTVVVTFSGTLNVSMGQQISLRPIFHPAILALQAVQRAATR